MSGGEAWHPKLPHCTQLAAKLPGKPTLAEELRTDGTETSAGESRPIRLASLACTSGAATRVSVDIFDSGKYDPRTLAPYRDGKVHDGPARAQAMFATETRGMTAVSPTEAYGSVDYAGGDCTTIEVERNVLVAVTFKGRGATPQERKANCREDGAKPTASVIHSIG
ncbi:hypothetical protein [Streptomyces sp. NPDC048106]|uniref:hypothetical protein n=1 Tax=Streptomyces sp. NPDC048106 TaxID=3155750 RepID=UPI0034558607